jgi:ABC-type transport system involved in cytochrome bd biosynthesis fused ATPase/permease subunit
MIQPEAPEEKKKGLAERLPKLGRLSQLILLIGVFLIIFVPLWLLNQQQPGKQNELRATLANMNSILAVEETPKAKLEAELAQVQAETEAIRAIFPTTSQSPEIIDSLLEIAELNDIYVTQTKVSTSESEGEIGPSLTIQLGLNGQVPKFQNFLLALDNKLPTSQIVKLNFTVVGEEGEEDTANITIDILCYEE